MFSYFPLEHSVPPIFGVFAWYRVFTLWNTESALGRI